MSYFTRLFTRSFGSSPRRWLLEHRLRRAAQRLSEGDEPIATVAAGCGWSDANNFARQFRRRFGVSPSGWRQR